MLTKNQKGQSLIEMLIVLGLVVVLVTSVVSASVRSLVTQRHSTDRDRAVKLAQSGMEIVRSWRDANWDTFRTYSGAWCFSDTALQTEYDEQTTNDCPTMIDAKYSRVVKFTWNALQDRMDVVVTVFWKETTYFSTSLTSFFTQWR